MAFPALQTLSTTDVSEHDPQWRCTKLSVADLLSSGEELARAVARTVFWLDNE